MGKPKKTVREKLAVKKEIKIVRLEKAFGGMTAGQKMLVATPQIVDAYIRNIPRGVIKTIPELRADLARDYKCDGTCPLSTSIFIRMSAEAALEDMADDLPEAKIAPFWRIIDSNAKMVKKLNLPDAGWLDDRRALESS